ncbi:Hypothetical predicted protein [Octopus vulgaris]|uniref:Uncharacterized protein n=1 Tax=Octopus vulgaris TaxID=6645 RepID=A0AA36AL42_OCTVU|nr:Hypothetical predicted protein [Octopus vulgaris]
MREKEHASRFHTIPEEAEEELSQLRLKCKHMAFTLEKRDEKVKELSDIIDQQKETISCSKQKVLVMESQSKTFSQQLEELKSKLKQEERKATDLREENEKLRKELSLEEKGRENMSRLQGNGMETLQNQLFLQKEEMEQLMECHLKSLEELNSAHRIESECLIQKYERRIADIICSQNSQNAAKEYQISMLESQLNNLKYENQLLQQKCKLKATGKELFKVQKNLANSLEDENTKSEDFIRQYKKCEIGKAEDSRLNPETSYRVDLENLKKDIKENLSKDLHKRLVTLLECIHQQELELQDLKNIWKQMNQNNKHLKEWLDNSGSANCSRECGSCGGGGCGCVSWQSTKKCNGTKDAVWYKDSMTGKATMLDVLSEPMKIAFVEDNKNVDPFNDSGRDHRCDSVHTSLVSRTLLNQPATSTTSWLDETYRMFLVETDLNHQAKVQSKVASWMSKPMVKDNPHSGIECSCTTPTFQRTKITLIVKRRQEIGQNHCITNFIGYLCFPPKILPFIGDNSPYMALVITALKTLIFISVPSYALHLLHQLGTALVKHCSIED